MMKNANEKNPHINGPAQFQPLLFKGQLHLQQRLEAPQVGFPYFLYHRFNSCTYSFRGYLV